MSRDLAIRLYDDFLRKQNKQIYLPQPFHKCCNSCTTTEIRGMIPPHYVCNSSRAVHICGETCEFTDENYVCTLTGLVKTRPLVYAPIYSKSIENKKVYEITRKLPNEKARRRRVIIPSKDKQLNTIRSFIVRILCGKERHQIYAENVDKYKKDVKECIRRKFGCHMPAHAIIVCAHQLYEKKERLMCPPLDAIDESTLRSITHRIYEYNQLISRHSTELSKLCANIEVFTAVMCHNLAVGYSIGNITIVHPEDPFIQHGPEEIQYGLFDGIINNHMSKMSRKIREACLTSSGYVNVKMMFPRRNLNQHHSPDP